MNLTIKKIVFAFTLNAIFFIGYSQKIDTSYVQKHDAQKNYYEFKSNIYEPGGFSFRQNVFNLDESISLVLLKSKTDELNWVHNKYLNYYNGIPIENSEFIVHCKDGISSFSANGNLIDNISLNTIPLISPELAINKALLIDNAEQYAWEDNALENNLKQKLNNPNATHYPLPELVIINLKTSESHTSYKLAYKIRIIATKPDMAFDYYIDAANGGLLQSITLKAEGCFNKGGHTKSTIINNDQRNTIFDEQANCGACNANTANTLYYGNQTINTGAYNVVNGDEGQTCSYRLIRTCSGILITASDAINANDPNNPTVIVYTNPTNTWGINGRSSTTALFCLEKSLEFYNNQFNRSSYDNNSGGIDIQVRNPNIQSNAYWNIGTRSIVIGTSGGNIPYELVNIDVVGHELTHGVNDFEANLVYQGESGALDESFADIMGTMIEYYTKSSFTNLIPNYLIGEEAFGGNSSLRDMAEPNNRNDPDTYQGLFWKPTGTGTNDFGGVHSNSAIQNYWFYLLAEGGSGINDIGNSYCVQSISKEKAMRIAYRNLTTYLTTLSDYEDARDFSIQSAIDLYGANSFEVSQVRNAWYAVGLLDNNPLIIVNQSVNNQQNVHWSNKIIIENTSITNGHYDVSSGTEIQLLQNVSVNSNTSASFYISANCISGERYSNLLVTNTSYEKEVSSVKENLESGEEYLVKIFPNPTNSLVTILINEGKELPKEIILRDLLGRKVLSLNNGITGKTELNLQKLPEGLYYINIVYDSQIYSEKVIKVE